MKYPTKVVKIPVVSLKIIFIYNKKEQGIR